jgi:thymidylate kinase
MRTESAKVISFSGIDGAGKSTQIEALERYLKELDFRYTTCTFWDNVVAFPWLREVISHKAFRGDKGVGSPEKPISRRDKNVQSWYATAARLVFYLLDTLSLRLTLAGISRGGYDFIIVDRYIYDELANLPLTNSLMLSYVRALLKLSPKPDIAYLVDADPEAARMRKPEYPLEFLRHNRDAYLTLSRLVEMKVVGPLSVEETTSQVLESISECLRTVPDPIALQQCAVPVDGPANGKAQNS